MSENKTGCECPLAGYCKRHDVTKSNHLHKLCKNHTGYFQQWEECRGPGQNFEDCVSKKNNSINLEKEKEEVIEQNPAKFPSLIQQGKNFGSSLVKHVLTGAKKTDESIQTRRMLICKDCPLYDAASDRCKDCGCYLPVKTSWESSTCPKGKW